MDPVVTKPLTYLYLIVGALFLFLVSPYLLLMLQFSLKFQTSWQELGVIVKNTVLQAIGSALLSISLGVLGGLGLLWFYRWCQKKKKEAFYSITEKLFLLPSLLPSLFVLIACLGVIKPFPFGKIGVILIHTLTYVGLVAVLFRAIALEKLGTLGTLSLVEGATRWQFFRVGVLGFLASDIFYLFLFVFATSMVSFNVPFLVGGASGATLEVLIYEKIMIHQSWSEATLLSLIQMGLMGILSLMSRASNLNIEAKNHEDLLELAEWKWGLIFPLIALTIVLYAPLISLPQGLAQLEFLKVSPLELMKLIANSLSLGILTGLVLFLFAIAACIGYELAWFRKFLNFYLPPGAILMGFAFFILAPYIELPRDLQISLGLSVVYFTGLYRLILASPLSNLLKQMEVAQVLGASPLQTFCRIIFPQTLKPLMFFCGMGSMWACGDFALSRMLSSEDFHLALVAKSLAAAYRLDAAQFLLLILYVVAALSFFFWWRLGHVLSRKFNH